MQVTKATYHLPILSSIILWSNYCWTASWSKFVLVHASNVSQLLTGLTFEIITWFYCEVQMGSEGKVVNWMLTLKLTCVRQQDGSIKCTIKIGGIRGHSYLVNMKGWSLISLEGVRCIMGAKICATCNLDKQTFYIVRTKCGCY